MSKIYIVVEGGLVQSVLSDMENPPDIELVDWDNIKAGDELDPKIKDEVDRLYKEAKYTLF